MRIDLKKLKRKYKRKFNKYKNKSERKISEYVEKAFEKAIHLYTKMSYINYIGRKLLIPFAWFKKEIVAYKESILDTSHYFINLGLYIFMYGLPYCLAAYIVSSKLPFNIPFNIQWIYVVGLVWYTFKEELPRILRSCFPPKSGIIHHE